MGKTGWADSADTVGETRELWGESQGHGNNLGQHFQGGSLLPVGYITKGASGKFKGQFLTNVI